VTFERECSLREKDLGERRTFERECFLRENDF